MIVKKLSVDGYKNLNQVLISPHEKYNLITGLNAQGKTNLLESIWLMSGCKSFRGSKERDYIGLDRKTMEMGLSFFDGRRKQIISYKMSRDSIKEKNITLNGVKIKGTSGLFDSFKCVVFTPDDSELIKGAPEKRRSFVDMCVCQIKPNSLQDVRRYTTLIENRNALLKAVNTGESTKEMISVWDRQTAAIGTLLSQKRNEYVGKLSRVCGELYKKISGGNEELTLSYSSNIYNGNMKGDALDVAVYFKKLYSTLDDDIRLGFTTYGAHRDDIIIKINGLNIKDFGSQGQKKTAALALKLGQAELYYKDRDEAPVILLDDVMGELDERRQEMVFDTIKGMQVFITACNENAVNGLLDGNHFIVENGTVRQV